MLGLGVLKALANEPCILKLAPPARQLEKSEKAPARVRVNHKMRGAQRCHLARWVNGHDPSLCEALEEARGRGQTLNRELPIEEP